MRAGLFTFIVVATLTLGGCQTISLPPSVDQRVRAAGFTPIPPPFSLETRVTTDAVYACAPPRCEQIEYLFFGTFRYNDRGRSLTAEAIIRSISKQNGKERRQIVGEFIGHNELRRLDSVSYSSDQSAAYVIVSGVRESNGVTRHFKIRSRFVKNEGQFVAMFSLSPNGVARFGDLRSLLPASTR